MRTRGTVIGSPATPKAPAPEEGGSYFREDDYISIDVPAGELTEEEQLSLALKASRHGLGGVVDSSDKPPFW